MMRYCIKNRRDSLMVKPSPEERVKTVRFCLAAQVEYREFFQKNFDALRGAKRMV